ncbi:hypothetical protein [Fischerella sp. PCC 9605]|uniref:hypothetical protein n=1 Tax=Fischerella sp. PCC 9605 TaxID=1173024 RepID=UPI0004B59829|nr:hypothetical protein [Fischerella sp. PCC 9605]
MLKKSFAFGLLAAGLLIAPTAAFAGEQSQDNIQETVQEGAAVNGSTNIQNSNSINRQQQFQRGSRNTPYWCAPTSSVDQAQRSAQFTGQSGAAVDGSVNVQNSNTENNQRQVALRKAGC